MDKFAKAKLQDKDLLAYFEWVYVESLFEGFFLLNHSTQGSPKLRHRQSSPYL
jgi:hypothetical protein